LRRICVHLSEIFPAVLISFLCIGTIALALQGIGGVMIVHYMRKRQQKATSQDWLSVEGWVIVVSAPAQR